MHFTNVIFNLLDNAVKYRSQERPLRLQVNSRDIGEDRPRSHRGRQRHRHPPRRPQEDIREILSREHGNRHDVKGFGLGLAYVRKMVDELGGTISVESEINVGTKFIIILPTL